MIPESDVVYVVMYPNLPQYAGLDSFLRVLANPDRGCTATCVSLLREASLYNHEIVAVRAAQMYPQYDEAHGPAEVRKVRIETRLVLEPS
jgi:hypothetical protein